MERLPITPEIRSAMERALEQDRALLPTLRHISGDDCEHCGCRQSIRAIEEDLALGTYEPGPEDLEDVNPWNS